MTILRPLLALAVLLLVAVAFSRDRRGIRWRTVVTALVLQVLLAVFVLRFPPGQAATRWFSERFKTFVGYTQVGVEAVFGPLASVGGSSASILALQVLPVIVFFGALIGLLFRLRVIQYVIHYVGGALGRLTGTTREESVYAAGVIFLSASEAPMLLGPFLSRLRAPQVFTLVTAGLTASSGSILFGYALLGAPLPYILAATLMNAPAALLMSKIVWPATVEEPVEERGGSGEHADRGSDGVERNESHSDHDAGDEPGDDEFDVRQVRDDESANVIDAVTRGTLTGGRVAVTVGVMLLAFVALIALLNGLLGAISSLWGDGDLTLQYLLGVVLSPFAWLLGVPWAEAGTVGGLLGLKTVLNEFLAFTELGPQVGTLSPVTVLVTTVALAGFANFGTVAIVIGTFTAIRPTMRRFVAKVGLRALLAAVLANLANAAIAGLVFVAF